MPDTTQPLDQPVLTPEALTALDDLSRITLDVARDLRLAATRLDDAEVTLYCVGRAMRRPAGDLSDRFADLRRAILASLPDSPFRSEALLCLAAAKDKAAHAALTAADHDSRLQAVHRLSDTTGPEVAA